MNTYLKYKPVWYRIMTMGSLLAAGFILLGLFSVFITQKMTNVPITQFHTLDPADPAMMKVTKVLVGLQSLFIFLLPSLLYAYFADPKPVKFLRLNVKPKTWHLLLGIVIMLIAIPSAFWLAELNKQMDLSHMLPRVDKWIRETESETNKSIEAILANQDLTGFFINLFIMALLPAIGEEILFRGLIQKGLIRSFRHVWVGILLSAFIFSFIHFQFLTFLTRFELGIILGALFWYTGSLWPAIIAHFFYNGLQVYISYKYPHLSDAPAWSVAAGLVGASFLLITLLIIVLRKSSTVSMYEVYDDEDDFDFEVGHKDEYLD